MLASELRQKSKEELVDLVKKTREDIEKAVTNTLQGKEKNVKKTGFMRKDVARIKTVLGELKEKEASNA
jgi:ribosomal protein L29